MEKKPKEGAPNSGNALSSEELNSLVRLARKALRCDTATRHTIQSFGVNVVPSNFYSCVPSVDDITNSFEFSPCDGPYNSLAVFDRGALVEFLKRLDGFADEFNPPEASNEPSPNAYYWRNPAFSWSDAMAYYCVLRLSKPRHVMEVGSGFSTLVALQAFKANGFGRLTCIEPFPMPWLKSLDVNLRREPVQSLSKEFFNLELVDGDVLFIDSTHTVKAGSDCLHLYLRILPELEANLMIHAHDIHLPFPMPRSDFDRHIYCKRCFDPTLLR